MIANNFSMDFQVGKDPNSGSQQSSYHPNSSTTNSALHTERQSLSSVNVGERKAASQPKPSSGARQSRRLILEYWK